MDQQRLCQAVSLSFVMWTLLSLSLIFDNNPVAWVSETIRISIFFLLVQQPKDQLMQTLGISHTLTTIAFGVSFSFAFAQTLQDSFLTKVLKKIELVL